MTLYAGNDNDRVRFLGTHFNIGDRLKEPLVCLILQRRNLLGQGKFPKLLVRIEQGVHPFLHQLQFLATWAKENVHSGNPSDIQVDMTTPASFTFRLL